MQEDQGTTAPIAPSPTTTTPAPTSPWSTTTTTSAGMSATENLAMSGARQLCLALAVVAGVITDVVALAQLGSGDGLTTVLGLWNVAASIAYYVVASRLHRRQDDAIPFGVRLTSANLGAEILWFSIVGRAYQGLNLDGTSYNATPTSFVVGMGGLIASDLLLLLALLYYRSRAPVPVPRVASEDVQSLRQQLQAASVEPGQTATSAGATAAVAPNPMVAASPVLDPTELFLQSKASFVARIRGGGTLSQLLRSGCKVDMDKDGVHFNIVTFEQHQPVFGAVFQPRVTRDEVASIAQRVHGRSLRVLVIGVEVEPLALQRHQGTGWSRCRVDVVDLTHQLTTLPPSSFSAFTHTHQFERHLQQAYGVVLARAPLSSVEAPVGSAHSASAPTLRGGEQATND